MNIGELVEKLQQYPPETPVVCDMHNGSGFCINTTAGVIKDDKLLCVYVGHVNDIETWNKDIITW